MIGVYRGFTIRLDSAALGYRFSIAYGGRVVYTCQTLYQSDAEGMCAAYGWLSANYERMLAGLRRVDVTDEDYKLSDAYLTSSDFLAVADKLSEALQYAARPYMSDDPFAKDIWWLADEIQALVLVAASNRLGEEWRAIKNALDDEQPLANT
jgi:hypothetical protein